MRPDVHPGKAPQDSKNNPPAGLDRYGARRKYMLECGLFAVAMVAVAQLVESRIVIPVVVGSSPISHPTKLLANQEFTPLLPAAFFLACSKSAKKLNVSACAAK